MRHNIHFIYFHSERAKYLEEQQRGKNKDYNLFFIDKLGIEIKQQLLCNTSYNK